MSYWLWVAIGILCVIAELALPGGIAGALGLSFLFMSGLLWFNWVPNLAAALGIWALMASLLLLALRPLMRRLHPSQQSRGSYEEDDSLRGTLVRVAEDIPQGGQGRVHVRGTTWMAAFRDGTQSAKAGASVRLVTRENIIWFVENVDTLEGDRS